MEKVLFIGIDFSKLSFDVTILHEGRLEESGMHSKFENSKKGISSFIKWMGKIYHGDLKRDALICGENTGIYSKLLADTLFLEGYTFLVRERVANQAQPRPAPREERLERLS